MRDLVRVATPAPTNIAGCASESPMACDTGLAVPAPLRPAGIENACAFSQALPPLEQTLTPALVLIHLEAVYSTTPPVRMSFFVVLRKYVRIPLYAVIEEASRSLPKPKFETAANYDIVAKRRTYVSKHRWIVISHAVEGTQEDESS